MSTVLATSPVPQVDLHAAVDAALARVPPLWPLRHFVAVNPFLGLVDRPFPEAAALLQRVTGAPPLQRAEDYRLAYAEGRISPTDLAAAADREWTPARLLAALDDAADLGEAAPLPTFADLLDRQRPGAHWGAFVVDEISKWCAVTFDENQTTWNSPWRDASLYAAWQAAAAHDRNAEIAGVTGFRAFVASLPADAEAAIAHCLEQLDPQAVDLTDFLHRQLATVAGWAGYVQYRVREDTLRGRPNAMLRDLLAIRLAYDTALRLAFAPRPGDLAPWRPPASGSTHAPLVAALARWQFAYEVGYQRSLASALTAAPAPRSGRPGVQAVFCIDVRSEVFRRHLEAALPGVQTMGFAGFFGFPVAHRTEASATLASRAPVLLVPPVETGEPLTPAAAAEKQAQRSAARAWKAFQNSATSCFSFVEAVGLGFSVALGQRTGSRRLACARVAPAFHDVPLATRTALAAGALRNLGLTQHFARLVLLCGHGGESANNPYASGLDCGACGGHAGDVNARLAVATLNDPAVRAELATQGLAVPADTVFVAGLHNTTTDDVELFDAAAIPASHVADLAQLRSALAEAGAATRRERAPSLGLAEVPNDQLDRAVRARAVDLAEVRPEWGLANNAALIAAPRARTAGLKLDGRVFLHDYDAASDPDDQVLTLILCAPVVVASWINLQYYASRIDPVRYGAGNKVLHNVVGGLGVLEGNGGDLKVGLPLQSIHDGTRFVHEPRRLAVYLDAAPERIAAVLQRHPGVRQLFDHGWLHLFSLQGTTCLRYRPGGTWQGL